MGKVELAKREKDKKLIIEKKIIKVKRVIDIETATLINTICRKYLIDNVFEDIDKIHIFKVLFDMIVVAKNTNIKVNGIENDNGELDVKVNTEIVKNFEELNIINKIKKYIVNYDSVWSNVLNFINNKIYLAVFYSLNAIVPSDEAIKDILEMTKFDLKDVAENEPQVIREQLIKMAKEVTKKENGN